MEKEIKVLSFGNSFIVTYGDTVALQIDFANKKLQINKDFSFKKIYEINLHIRKHNEEIRKWENIMTFYQFKLPCEFI